MRRLLVLIIFTMVMMVRGNMRQYTQREFIKIVKKNGFHYNHTSGSHAIYYNNSGRHISIPRNLECVIAQRLIKENNLK